MTQVLYLYAIGRAQHELPRQVEAVDGSDHLAVLQVDGLAAFYSEVDDVDFSQAVIDARSKDVEWLGGIGYRHQAVMAALMRGGTVIPLRAFTLFNNESSLRSHVLNDATKFKRLLDRLEGKQEWTLRIEFEPEKWRDALVRRVEALQNLNSEIAQTTAGKAYLLRKKLDEERKRASREAEQQIVDEVESAIAEKLACQTISESRLDRGGAFPQINVLINRDEEAHLQELRDELDRRYASEGITLALTGPWPPYTFVGTMNAER